MGKQPLESLQESTLLNSHGIFPEAYHEFSRGPPQKWLVDMHPPKTMFITGPSVMDNLGAQVLNGSRNQHTHISSVPLRRKQKGQLTPDKNISHPGNDFCYLFFVQLPSWGLGLGRREGRGRERKLALIKPLIRPYLWLIGAPPLPPAPMIPNAEEKQNNPRWKPSLWATKKKPRQLRLRARLRS